MSDTEADTATAATAATTATGAVEAPLDRLQFSVFGFVSRPSAEVYEAVVDPEQISRCFTTGGAQGRLEPGNEVTWDFADFPGRFPVTPVEAEPGRRVVIEWGAAASTTADGGASTRVTFAFEPVDEDTRTRVTITEDGWRATRDGAGAAFGNCMGWTGFLAALKAWTEHGINLREGFYA